MENTIINNNNNNNKDDENKYKYLEARRRAARAFHERNKIMNYINKNKEKILKEFIRTIKKEL